jgi:hypothetical protein
LTILLALAAIYAAMMLVRYGRRGLLVLAPGLLRFGADAGAPPATPGQLQAGEALESLGFRRLGRRVERGPLGGLDLRSDAWVHEGDGAYADVFDHPTRPGAAAWLYFLSAFPDGAVALTANHPRASRSDARVEAGGVPGAAADATWAVHRRAVGRLAARHGAPAAPPDLARREAAARAWYRAAGNRELRRLFLLHFLNALFAAAILGYAARGLWRLYRTG